MTTTEQRRDERHPVEKRADLVDLESGVEFEVELCNLSSAGVMLCSQLEPVVGADMTLRFDDARRAMRVVRVTRGAQGFEVAGQLGG
jgi:hypothetical protein